MTNAVAIRAIRWTPSSGPALDCQRADLSIHLEIVTGLDDVPAVRGVDTIVPGLTGRIPRNRVADVLAIELAGWVQGGTGASTEAARRTGYRNAVDAIQAAFDPSLDPGTLEVDTEDGETRVVSARALTLVWGREDIPAVRALSVALESTDPFWSTGS